MEERVGRDRESWIEEVQINEERVDVSTCTHNPVIYLNLSLTSLFLSTVADTREAWSTQPYPLMQGHSNT